MNRKNINKYKKRWFWDDNIVWELIEAVKQNPFLWDHHNHDYHNIGKKKIFWDILATELNSKYNPHPKLRACDINIKWKDLRSHFATFYKNKLTIENFIISWRFYEPLEFLIPRMKLNSEYSLKAITHEKKDSSSLYNLRDSLTIDSNTLNSIAENNNSSILLRDNQPNEGSTNQLESGQDSSHKKTNIKSSLSIKQEKEESYTLEIPPEDLTSVCYSLDSIAENSDSSLLTNQPPMKGNTNQLRETTGTANNAFGVYVGLEITQLDPDLQICAKKQISDILMELNNDQLKRKVLSCDE